MKIALIIIAFTVTAVGLYERDTWPLWATLGLSALFFAWAIIRILVEIRDGKKKAKSKVLLSIRKNAIPQLELGNGGTILAFTGRQRQPLFKILADSSLTIIVDGGSVKVSSIIRDRTGAAVAELINNEWKINRDNAFDRNYSKDALEVKNSSGDVVLQVRILDDRIQFQGKLYDRKGNGMALGKNSRGQGGIVEGTGPNHPHLEMKIEPIFVYPSENHLGVFRNAKES